VRAAQVLGFVGRHPDGTLLGREAGESPAQSRYGDHCPLEARDGSPDADPQWLLNLREKG
jgi:hypothetical protein